MLAGITLIKSTKCAVFAENIWRFIHVNNKMCKICNCVLHIEPFVMKNINNSQNFNFIQIIQTFVT